MALEPFTPSRTSLIGHVDLDSGQILIVDPCYVVDDETYDEICEASDDTPLHVVDGLSGVVAVAPHGDASFPVYAEFDAQGQIARVVIDIAGTGEQR